MRGKGSISNTSHLHAKSHPSHEKRSSSKIQNRECISVGRGWGGGDETCYGKIPSSKIQNRECISVGRGWSGDDETCYGKIPSSKIQNRECILVGRGWSGVDGAYMKE